VLPTSHRSRSCSIAITSNRTFEGYLSGDKRNHIYLFDTASEKLEQITKGDHDETEAVMSPDGTKIAYVSSADRDPDAL
jgi:WD40-like Beta Propeller Repeat